MKLCNRYVKVHLFLRGCDIHNPQGVTQSQEKPKSTPRQKKKKMKAKHEHVKAFHNVILMNGKTSQIGFVIPNIIIATNP